MFSGETYLEISRSIPKPFCKDITIVCSLNSVSFWDKAAIFWVDLTKSNTKSTLPLYLPAKNAGAT